MVKAFKPWSRGLNCWTANPFLSGIQPYRDLYDTDDGGDISSGYMWAIFIYEQNDEEVNPYYGAPDHVKDDFIEAHLVENFNKDNEFFVKGRELFAKSFMSHAQRALKMHEENIERMVELCQKTPLTFDMPDPDSKSRTITGTAKQIAALQKSINVLFKELGPLKEAFALEKEEAQIKGGRRETLSEKGII